MKETFKGCIKIYLIFILYAVVSCITYSLILYYTKLDFNPISKIVICGFGFFIVGFSFGNLVHKRGLIVGIIIGLLHILLLKIGFFLAQNTFEISYLFSGINILLSGIGGIIGMNIKKIF